MSEQFKVFKRLKPFVIYDKSIGRGMFGEVMLAANEDSNQKFAAKVINIRYMQSLHIKIQDIVRQVQVLKSIKSKYVVQLEHVQRSENNYYLYFQLCDFSLKDFIENNFNEELVKKYIFQIAKGYETLYKSKIVHRDLKPQNILLKDGKVKIADFGLSKMFEKDQQPFYTRAGSPQYMSYQTLNSQPYTYKCDIYSLGVIFYQMLHRKVPYPGRDTYQIIEMMDKKQIQYESNLSQECRDLLKRMLVHKQQQRMGLQDLIDHPFIQKLQKSEDESRISILILKKRQINEMLGLLFQFKKYLFDNLRANVEKDLEYLFKVNSIYQNQELSEQEVRSKISEVEIHSQSKINTKTLTKEQASSQLKSTLKYIRTSLQVWIQKFKGKLDRRQDIKKQTLELLVRLKELSFLEE